MRIVVDENVPYGPEAFGGLGEVVTAPGRGITRETVAEADALVVRSITKVNEALLEGTPVKFVGTCTIGEDHIDKAYLAARNIGFSSAPGCNANSVAEYIVAALLVLSRKLGFSLPGATLGIVGVGNVGSRVLAKAEALGMTCVLNDPPLAERTGDARYRPIEAIHACDVVTCHVPLEKSGAHPTWHLVDAEFIDAMKDGAILFNSARGPVVDNAACNAALASGKLAACLLDVWEGEPDVDEELLRRVDIASPHIAGYSFDGKVNGTKQVFNAMAAHFGTDETWDPVPLLPEPECPALTLDAADPGALSKAVGAVYDIMADDAAMRGLLDRPVDERRVFFDRLRKEYPRRREFQNTVVALDGENDALRATLRGIGFQVR